MPFTLEIMLWKLFVMLGFCHHLSFFRHFVSRDSFTALI